MGSDNRSRRCVSWVMRYRIRITTLLAAAGLVIYMAGTFALTSNSNPNGHIPNARWDPRNSSDCQEINERLTAAQQENRDLLQTLLLSESQSKPGIPGENPGIPGENPGIPQLNLSYGVSMDLRENTKLLARAFEEFEGDIPRNLPDPSDSVIDGLNPIEDDTVTIIGYCDDHIHYFVANVAPYIIPWKPFKLVFTPHLGRRLSGRAVHDIRFNMKKVFPKDRFPHILFCQGWNYEKHVKQIRKDLKPRSEGFSKYPKDEWVDGVYWPSNADFYTHRKAKRPFIISASLEAGSTGGCKQFDVILDTKTTNLHHGCPTIWASMGIFGLSDHILRGPQDLVIKPGFNASRILQSKSGFAAFLYQRCDKKFYGNFAGLRVAFFDLLKEKYKQPDGLGGCRRSKSPKWRKTSYITRGSEKASYMDEAVEMFGRYKFVISMENSHVPGYMTEKIINALLANTIPIYLGDPNITDYINPKRFIHCKLSESKVQGFERRKFSGLKERLKWARDNFPGLETCMNRVKEIDENDELYKSIISEPILTGNKVEGTIFDYAYYGKRIRQVLTLEDSDLLR